MFVFTKQNFLILVDLWMIDKHFSFEYQSHTFYPTALQTAKHFWLTRYFFEHNWVETNLATMLLYTKIF